MRTPQDYKTYFSQASTGSAETGVAQGYWLIKNTCPDIKTVVVRRPLEDCVNSLLDIDFNGKFYYNKESLTKHLSYTDRMLDYVSSQPDVVSVEYKDLKNMSSCKKVFEHCLPYEFDIKHWGRLKNQNLQVNVPEHRQYYTEHRDEINNFKKLCKSELIRLKRLGQI